MVFYPLLVVLAVLTVFTIGFLCGASLVESEHRRTAKRRADGPLMSPVYDEEPG